MKKRLLYIIVILMILAGLSLLLYPTVSNYILSLRYHQTISNYRAQVDRLDADTYETLLDDARAYNQRLTAAGPTMRDLDEEELLEYNSLLDPLGTGIMGYVVIPKIEVSLPIYHGVDDAVLQSGIGHLPGTSLPVGGEGTHTIISGHRGLVSSRLFTDIDQLVVGDVFSLRVLNEVLIYEVDQIITILPSQLGLQKLEPDQDYCTLLTCTPYGVNTHRLLVRGRRIPTPEEGEEVSEQIKFLLNMDESGGEMFGIVTELFYLLVVLGVLLVVLVVVLVVRRLRRKRHRPKRLKKKEKSSEE